MPIDPYDGWPRQPYQPLAGPPIVPITPEEIQRQAEAARAADPNRLRNAIYDQLERWGFRPDYAGVTTDYAGEVPGVEEASGAEDTWQALQAGNWKGAALAAGATLLGVLGPPFLGKGVGGIAAKLPGQWLPEDIYDENFQYSPSLLAALNHPQRRGPYDQLRAAMIQKGGAKAEELAWTGADRAFAGQQDVDLDDVVKYLQEHQQQTASNVNTATGVIGRPGDSRYALQERYVERELPAEIARRGENVGREFDEMPLLSEVDRKAQLEVANLMGWDEHDLGIFMEQHPTARVDPYGYWPHETRAGYIERNLPNLESAARREVRERARDMPTRQLFWAVNSGATMIPPFDPGNTRYYQHFTPGGANYNENFRLYDPTGTDPNAKLRADERSNTHFSQGPAYAEYSSGYGTKNFAPTLYHTRAADFPVEGGGTAYHLGEVQSDFSQGSRATITESEKIKAAAEADLRRAETNRASGLGPNYDDYLAQQGLPPVTDDDIYMNPYQRQEILPGFGEEEISRTAPLLEDQGPIDLNLPTTMATPEQEFLAQQEFPLNQRLMELGMDVYGDYGHQPAKLEAYVPFGVDELPLTVQGRGANTGAAWAEDPRRTELQSAREKAQAATDARASTLPNAPFMRTTDQWVRQALREELGSAVSRARQGGEGAPTHFTLGTGEQAVGMVGGDVAGQGKFYDTIVPKNMNDILRKLGPFQLGTVPIQTTGVKKPGPAGTCPFPGWSSARN